MECQARVSEPIGSHISAHVIFPVPGRSGGKAVLTFHKPSALVAVFGLIVFCFGSRYLTTAFLTQISSKHEAPPPATREAFIEPHVYLLSISLYLLRGTRRQQEQSLFRGAVGGVSMECTFIHGCYPPLSLIICGSCQNSNAKKKVPAYFPYWLTSNNRLTFKRLEVVKCQRFVDFESKREEASKPERYV